MQSTKLFSQGSNCSFVPSCWREALCALLPSLLACLMFWNWWAGLSFVQDLLPFPGRNSTTTEINDPESKQRYSCLDVGRCERTQSCLMLQLGGDPGEGALYLRKTMICRLLGRNWISLRHNGPCPGSQVFYQTLIQQMDPQGLWVYGSRESALLAVCPYSLFNKEKATFCSWVKHHSLKCFNWDKWINLSFTLKGKECTKVSKGW